MSKKTIYKLIHPIEVASKKITKVEMRRVKVADLGASRDGKDDHEQTKIMLTRIAELSPEEVDELDAVDWQNLSDEVMAFLEPPQAEKA